MQEVHMGYDRYSRGNSQGDMDYGRDYGSGRDYTYSSARDYEASGYYDRDQGRDARDRYGRDDNRSPYGQRDYGNRGYGARDSGRDRYDSQRGYGQAQYARGDEYHGSYASDGHRWEDVGSRRHQDDDSRGPRGRDYGRPPQGYDYQDRGFIARAGDEVRSWFGDEDAERRREADTRYDERSYGQRDRFDRDSDYHSWRSGQIAALDRDYDEYRRENRTKFESEFSTWRGQRQTQRDSLTSVKEHAEVVGSDGSHVGTVDKVRGDRILLTKTDADAGGRHHSIPSSWITTVDEKKVTLSRTADDAKRQWRDEENNQALFGDRSAGSSQDDARTLNRSFSGTY
jgi:hypothetical protein